MSDLFVIYSPKGEKFELSLANFKDLITVPGWDVNPPSTSTAAIAAVTVEPAPVVPVAPTADDAEETETETAEETETATDTETQTEDQTEAEEPKARLTVEDFADLTEKKDVFAYIEATFPGNKIDGRANRDKLIEIAIELANATAE